MKPGGPQVPNMWETTKVVPIFKSGNIYTYHISRFYVNWTIRPYEITTYPPLLSW